MYLDKLIFTYKEAKSLGCIARINGLERVPIRDKKLMAEIKGKSTKAMDLYMRSWLSGYDEMNLEYAMVEFNFESLFNEN
jgi:hypothetical protein